MSDFVHIEPADEQRRAFARWALTQSPKLQTSSSTGTDVPTGLYPDVPPELLEGAYVDGFLYGGVGSPQPAAVKPQPVADPPADDSPKPQPRKKTPRTRKAASLKPSGDADSGGE